jgi:hypothetical protein
MKKNILLFPFISILLITACNVTSAKTKLQPPTGDKIYFSAFPDFGGSEDNVSAGKIKEFEKIAGKRLAWACFSQNWFNGIVYPKHDIHAIHDAGVMPYVRLMPRTDEIQNHPEQTFTLQRIIDGKFDKELKKWAYDAKTDGIPIFIDFAVEMNGEWFPWSGVFNGGAVKDKYGDKNYPDGPERYRDAYRHIIDLFRAEGVQHVTWTFHVNYVPFPDKEWNYPKNYYPGDDYIDWIGFSLYGAQEPSEEWEGLEFSTQFKQHYKQFNAISSTKPKAVFEFGVIEDHPDGNKSAWLGDAFKTILDNPYMTIQAISPWHEKWQNEDETWSNLRLDSSARTQATFQKWVKDPRFISDVKLK